MDRLRKIRNRQQKRGLVWIKKELADVGIELPIHVEKGIVRSYGFFEQDVEAAIEDGTIFASVPKVDTPQPDAPGLTADERAERKAQELVQRMAGQNRG